MLKTARSGELERRRSTGFSERMGEGSVGVGRGGMSKINTADSDLSDETEGAQAEVKLTRMRQGETF